MPDPIPTLPAGSAFADANNGLVFGNNLIDTLMGTSKSTTVSPSTTIQSTQVDPAALESIMRQILEGTNGNPGISSIFNATQNSVGGYNSTTGRLLANDLISRIMGEVAKVTAQKTTTNSGNTTTSTTPGKATQAAGLAAAAKALQALSKKKAENKTNPEKSDQFPGGINSPQGQSPEAKADEAANAQGIEADLQNSVDYGQDGSTIADNFNPEDFTGGLDQYNLGGDGASTDFSGLDNFDFSSILNDAFANDTVDTGAGTDVTTGEDVYSDDPSS